MLLLEAARAREEALEEVSEELRDLEAMEARFGTGEVDASDVKYMKQRVFEARRSQHLAKERIRRTGE